MDLLKEATTESLMITGIVMVMMLLIEYFNVFSKGRWSGYIQKSNWKQVLFSASLGATPGCVGVYAVVSLFMHRIIGFGGLLAALLATVGDEAFIMMSMIPGTYVILSIILFVLAIGAGIITSFVYRKNMIQPGAHMHEMIQHEEDVSAHFQWSNIVKNFRSITFPRAMLIFGNILLILGLITGILTHNEHPGMQETGHSSWDFMRITFLAVSIACLIIVTIVSDHFLEHHLWEHIIQKHFLRILLWTFGTLLVIGVLTEYLHLTSWLRANTFTVLILAMLVGVIPISGPHIAFITLFAQGTVPFCVLLANSIVQDGHGGLPLFAESQRSFFLAKGIKLILAFFVGILGMAIGF